jgi:hypothetical protein
MPFTRKYPFYISLGALSARIEAERALQQQQRQEILQKLRDKQLQEENNLIKKMYHHLDNLRTTGTIDLRIILEGRRYPGEIIVLQGDVYDVESFGRLIYKDEFEVLMMLNSGKHEDQYFLARRIQNIISRNYEKTWYNGQCLYD